MTDPNKMEYINPNTPIPLWHRFPSVFLYGLRLYPILFAIAFSGIEYFIKTNLLLMIPLYAILFKYAFEVIRRSSEGDITPPPLSYSVLIENYDLPVKMFVMMVFFGALVYSVTSTAGAVTGLVLLLFGLFVYPASLMVLATTESILSALNPLLLIAMIIRIRWAYLILTGLLMLLSQAELNFAGLMDTTEPNPLASLLLSFAIVYFKIINFHMMGYVLFQNIDRLNGGNSNTKAHHASDDSRLALYREFLDQGKAQAALAELNTLIHEFPEDMELHKRLHNLLLMEQENEATGKHAANDYIPRLLKNGKDFQAADVYVQCVTRNIAVNIGSSKQVVQLAEALRGIGKGKQAVQLIKGFHKSFPGDIEVVDAYILSAKICCEDLNRDDLSKNLLEYILKQHPSHPRADEANQYLVQVLNLQ